MAIANIFDILTYGFFQKALLMSILAAIPCAIIGTYIVIKRISMITGSISHAAFGGLGIGYFFGFNPLLGATLFGVISGASIGVLQRRAKSRLDSILSFLWAFGMAVGLIFLYLTPGYAQDLFTYLFGNIFLITNAEITALSLMNILIIIVVLLCFQTFKQVLFDEEFAEVRNVPIVLVNVIFFILVGLTIIVILSLVGVVLLIAFLTLPPSTALFFQKSIKKTMILSGIIMAVANILGLFTAHFLNLPPGPVIVMILSVFYIAALLNESFTKKFQKAHSHIEPHECAVELESFGVFQKYLQTEDQSHTDENSATPTFQAKDLP